MKPWSDPTEKFVLGLTVRALASMHGVVCMMGMVGNSWEFEKFSPMSAIPTTVSLTTYSGGVEDFINTPLQSFIDNVEAGKMSVQTGPVFSIGEIVEAHRTMEEDRAAGKIVILA